MHLISYLHFSIVNKRGIGHVLSVPSVNDTYGSNIHQC